MVHNFAAKFSKIPLVADNPYKGIITDEHKENNQKRFNGFC
jgi:hypothetical protein